MLLIVTSTGDRLFGFINIDDLERPWTLKILILNDFLAIFGCKRVNCDEMDGDRLRLPANRNCYRLLRISWALLKLLVHVVITTNMFMFSHVILINQWNPSVHLVANSFWPKIINTMYFTDKNTRFSTILSAIKLFVAARLMQNWLAKIELHQKIGRIVCCQKVPNCQMKVITAKFL